MKLGIIGSGMIVKDLLSFIHYLPQIECIHLSGTKRSEQIVKELAQNYGFKRYSTCYDDLLEDEEVDVVYVAVPNNLHYEFALKALNANKHVILEKPFTVTENQAKHLQEIAIERHLFLWEAITNQYLPQYECVRNLLDKLGDIKLIQLNYSQYSSRYDAFKRGEILPAFDVNKAGGALMDLNVYNIYFVVGLFGEPNDVHYYPCIKEKIDTSGILILDYGDFKCVLSAAKDSNSCMYNTIQGDRGYVMIPSSVSVINEVHFIENKKEPVEYMFEKAAHRMYFEFQAFEKMYQERDFKGCYRMLEKSVVIMRVLDRARASGGIIF